MADTPSEAPAKQGRGPFFWAGLILGAYGAIGGLALSDAIDSTTALLLMIAPTALAIPMFKAASRRVEAGGAACVGKGQAQKRYVKRVLLFTSLYLLSFAVMTFVEASGTQPTALRAVLAVLPGLAIIGVFWAVGRLIVEEQDEFLRMLTIRQSLIATGVALSAASVWGFLEAADLVPHLDAYWVAVAWFVGLFVGAVVNRIEYGTWGAV